MPLDTLRAAAVVLELLLLAALLYRKLGLQMPLFTTMVAVSAARSLLLASMSPSTQSYADLWKVTEPVLGVLEVACVHEAFRMGLARYRRLGQAGTWALAGAGAVAVLATALTLMTGQGEWKHPALRSTITYHRALTGLAVMFLTLTILMLNRYRVPESPGYRLHRQVLWLFLTSKFLTLWGADLVGQRSIAGFNDLLMSATCACLMAWTWVLRPGGEPLGGGPDDDDYWRGRAEAWLNRTDQSRLSEGNARL